MSQDDEYMTVTLTLRKPVAERLRSICHARCERASIVVDRWILSADAEGHIGQSGKTPHRDAAQQLVDELLRGRGL